MSAPVPPGHPPASPYAAGPQPYGWMPPAPPAQGRGLAIAALVLSGLALLVALGVGAGLVYLGSGAGYTALTGELGAVEGERVAGADLETAITDLHESTGSLVEMVACPESSTVSVETVVTCRSVVDGADWIEHVLLHEDGTFTLLRL